MPTPRNSRANTRVNAVLDTVERDVPSPSPLPRESLLLPPPCQYQPPPARVAARRSATRAAARTATAAAAVTIAVATAVTAGRVSPCRPRADLAA